MAEPFSIDEYVAAHMRPIVPSELVQYTCGPDKTQFELVRSGAEVYLMLNFAARKHDLRGIDEHPTVLDFGCGNGRILRFLDTSRCRVFGTDVSAENVEFARPHFPRVSLSVNQPMPPLDYRDAMFELIYSFSVFSHLSLDAETVWLRELARIGQPGCLYLLSVHGDWVIEATLGDATEQVQQAGFFWKRTHGPDSKFPDYYEVSYHTSNYVRQNWQEYFDILDIVKGDNPLRYVSAPDDQDAMAVARQLRPMGQDLVIARKRA